jgi:hypothetical protein
MFKKLKLILKKILLRSFNLEPRYEWPLHRNDRVGALHRAWGHVYTNHLVGDYFEFGVYKGGSFIASIQQYRLFRAWLEAELISKEMWRREVAHNYSQFSPRFYGIDTFQGMPQNDEGNVTFQEGTFKCDFDSVIAEVEKEALGVDYKLFKGLFMDCKESFLSIATRKAAVINIDGDLYQSTVDALNIVEERIQVGTVILFDDFNCYNANKNAGERRAFSEFRDKSLYEFEEWFSYHYSGQAFLCVGEKRE